MTFYPFLIHLTNFCFPCGCHGNDITPTSDKVFGLEGDVINLSCNYSSASTFQWYQQYPGSSPIFLLLTTVSSNPSVVNATPPYPHLSIKLNKERTRLDLEISSANVTDSRKRERIRESILKFTQDTG
uniref:Immunoglobulin V-set domain-containing protein n=1 Tax=Oncorhynchus tshawytscha TaxID=74940 RepID=A0AAZ3Q1M6_ONCTS